MDSPKTKNKIKEDATEPRVLATIRYAASDNLRTNFLTGVVTSTTPEGSVNLVGFVERKSFPDRAIITEVPEEQGGGGAITDEGGRDWVREIQTSFVISIETAENLIELLKDTVSSIKTRQLKAVRVKEKRA